MKKLLIIGLIFFLLFPSNFSAAQKIELEEVQGLVDEFILEVDYTRTLKQMIVLGKYDWINDSINEKNFLLPTELLGKKEAVSAKLFNFNQIINTKEVISELDKAGYRPANLAEILALAEKRPYLQEKFLVVALGSVWNDIVYGPSVPVLGFDELTRGLFLARYDKSWRPRFCFLGVRK